MAKQENIEFEGVVKEKVKGGKFIVSVPFGENGEKDIMCTPSGKINMNNIRIVQGDNVTIEVSPYDLTKGRIIWRSK